MFCLLFPSMQLCFANARSWLRAEALNCIKHQVNSEQIYLHFQLRLFSMQRHKCPSFVLVLLVIFHMFLLQLQTDTQTLVRCLHSVV